MLYAAALAAGLLALFAAGAWTSFVGAPPGIHILALASIVLAVGGLLWLRPRLRLYMAGGVCLAVALLVLWAVRPDVSMGADKAIVAILLFVLFPLAWMLLATSVTSWQIGAISYLLAGLTLVLDLVAASAVSLGISGLSFSWLMVLVALNWPFYSLVILGLFGHSFN